MVGGEKLSDALKANLLNAAGRVGARQIGKAYGAKDLTSFEHKALHAALGGAIGALSSDNPAKGALSGAVAGALSEIIADLITTKPEEAIQQALNDSSNPNALRDFLQNYEDHVGLTTDIAQVLTAAIAAALNLDIQVANNVANNAVKNNMLPMMLAGAAALATDVAVAQFLRQIGVTLGAVAIAKIMDEAKDGPLASLTENQWKSLISLFKAQENAMDAAPDLGRQDEGFDAHARGIQVNATPLPENRPTTLATPLPENLPSLEGFGIYEGIDTSILFNELKSIVDRIKVTSHGVQRKIEREVKSIDELDALKRPLKVTDVKTDHLGRPSQRFIGKKATVAINPESNTIVSVNPTSSKLAQKLQEDK